MICFAPTQVYACLHPNEWLAKVAGPTGALEALVAMLSIEGSEPADALRLRSCAALALTALCSAHPDAGTVSKYISLPPTCSRPEKIDMLIGHQSMCPHELA